MNKNLLRIGLLFALFLLNGSVVKSARPLQVDCGFTENKGQFKDQDGSKVPDVLYLYDGAKVAFQLRKTGFSYDIKGLTSNGNGEYTRIDFNFINPNASMKVVATQPLIAKRIYRKDNGNGSGIEVSQYAKVTYYNVFPHTDIEFVLTDELTGSGFKYNIILHPGSDPAQVLFNICSEQAAELSREGSLVFETAAGKVYEEVPLSYIKNREGQKGDVFTAGFVNIGNGIFGFTPVPVPGNFDVVVDPVLWSTYFGGDGYDMDTRLVSDSSGNLYVAGRTSSSNGIATTGAYKGSLTSGNPSDGYLAKFSPSGTLLWSTYFGGESVEVISDLALLSNQTVVIAGYTISSTGISSPGAYQVSIDSLYDGFLMQFNPAGGYIRGTYLGFNNHDYLQGISIGDNNEIYITGYTYSTREMTMFPGVYQTRHNRLTDGFVARMDSVLQLKWYTYIGDSMDDMLFDIDVTEGGIYVSGYTISTKNITTNDALHKTLQGGQDILFSKFNFNGGLIYSTYLGGSSNDYGFAMDVSPSGKVYIAGSTYSTSGIATSGAYKDTITTGNVDLFLLCTDTFGLTLWGTYIGGTGTENIGSVKVDKAGDAYIIGNTTSKDIVTINTNRNIMAGNYDIIFGSFTPSGTCSMMSYLGGSAYELGRSIEVDRWNNKYFAGYTSSDTGVATPGSLKPSHSNNFDAFVFKYGVPVTIGPIINNVIQRDEIVCDGQMPSLISGSLPSGGDGTYTYKWVYSTSGSTGPFSPASGVNDGETYQPSALPVSAWFKRIVYSDVYIDTSNVVSVLNAGKLNAGFTVNKMIQCIRDNQFIFTDTTTAPLGGTLTYAWDFGNGVTSVNVSETISYVPSVKNNYTVRLITTLNGGCRDTSSVRVFLNSNPVAKTISGNATPFARQNEIYSVPASIGSTYKWWFANASANSSTSLNSVTLKWISAGTYELKVLETSSGNCPGDTSRLEVVVSPPVGIDEATGNGELKLYPDPVQNTLFLDGAYFVEAGKQFNVKVFNLSGKLVLETWVNTAAIDVSMLTEGMYVIEVIDQQEGIYLFGKVVKTAN